MLIYPLALLNTAHMDFNSYPSGMSGKGTMISSDSSHSLFHSTDVGG